jgi:hypothetical protein
VKNVKVIRKEKSKKNKKLENEKDREDKEGDTAIIEYPHGKFQTAVGAGENNWEKQKNQQSPVIARILVEKRASARKADVSVTSLRGRFEWRAFQPMKIWIDTRGGVLLM